MSLLDQFFVYHPEPWKDQDWKVRSGMPLEDVWFTAADGTKLFGWYVENAETSAVLLWCHGNAGQHHQMEAIGRTMLILLSFAIGVPREGY